MGIKQFNGNLMSLHRIASFAYARDISIEIESTAILNKEHLNHSIIVQKKKLKFVKNKKKIFKTKKERLELITFELVF